MSHLRRVVGVVLLALVAWLLTFGTVGAVESVVTAAPTDQLVQCC